MDIKQLLDYQEKDLQLFRLESDLRKCEEAKKVAYFTNSKQKALEEIQRINRHVAECFKNFEKLDELYARTEKEITDISATLATIEEEKELDYYTKTIDKLKFTTEALERETKKLQAELDYALKTAKQEQNKAMKSHEALIKCMDEFKAKKEVLQKQAQPIMAELKEMVKGIESDIFARYKQKRAQKMPVLVEYRDKSCSGCGMELSSSTCEKLETGEMIECSTCGRIVYKK